MPMLPSGVSVSPPSNRASLFDTRWSPLAAAPAVELSRKVVRNPLLIAPILLPPLRRRFARDGHLRFAGDRGDGRQPAFRIVARGPRRRELSGQAGDRGLERGPFARPLLALAL